MTNSIPGKTMLITGASSGIGKATAIACAQAGMNVVLTARRRKQLEALQEEIGGTTKIIVGDVTEDGFNEKLLRATGTFDAVFINAGHGIDQHTLDMNMKDVRSLFELNVFAAIELASLCAKQFKEQGSGHIILCASCLSKFATPKHGAYCASKSAIEVFGKSMRMELKSSNINVSTLHPIGTRTEFFKSSESRSGTTHSSFEELAPSWLMQPPERVANAVVKCLRKPKPEIWTSLFMRIVSTLFSAFPRLAQFFTSRFG